LFFNAKTLSGWCSMRRYKMDGPGWLVFRMNSCKLDYALQPALWVHEPNAPDPWELLSQGKVDILTELLSNESAGS